MAIELATVIVHDYDEAVHFFTQALGFVVVTDEPATTNDGRQKRWVVVRPADGGAGLLLAQADGARQVGRIGDQTGGRVAFFLRVDDFQAAYSRLVSAGAELVGDVRHEPYGPVQIFRDISGNRWDLLGPASG